MDYDPFQRIRATFRPKRTDDLKPGVAKLVGQRMVFEAGFQIEAGFDYAGQIAWYPIATEENGLKSKPMVGWMPTEDLEDVEVIARDEAYEKQLQEIRERHMTARKAEPWWRAVYSASKESMVLDPAGRVMEWRAGIAPPFVQFDEEHRPQLVDQPFDGVDDFLRAPEMNGALSGLLSRVDALSSVLRDGATGRLLSWSGDRRVPYYAVQMDNFAPPAAARLPQEEVDGYNADLRKLGLDDAVIFRMDDGGVCFMWSRNLSDEEVKRVNWYLQRRLLPRVDNKSEVTELSRVLSAEERDRIENQVLRSYGVEPDDECE